MPRDPFFPDSTGSVRAVSPNDASGGDRKRRRKVLSCYDCRRRKLQCDRAMPACGRCTKAGQAASCIYLDDASDTPTRNVDGAVVSNADPIKPPFDTSMNRAAAPAPPPGDLLSRLEYQDRRIKELEGALSQANQGRSQQWKTQTLPLTPESIVGGDVIAPTVAAADRETMLLRGKSFKTQFHGMTHPGSLLAYIPELGAFTKEALERYPTLYRTRQDLKALEDRTAYAGPKHRFRNDGDLTAMLSSQPETDELVQLYLDNYDNIYHIIHLPSFRQEYYELWSDLSNARGHFVAIVVLMMATVQCLKTSEPRLYTANSSVAREKALAAVGAVEDWLLAQSQKHVTISDFQIRFLLNLAKLTNASKFKRTWTDAGAFLRFCMAAGLHRNPELLRKPTSALDKEMRRRVWFAAAEFELQSSFDRGMISSPWIQQGDYVAPSNLPDDEFSEETQVLPGPRALREFTSTSYLATASETFMLRYSLNSALNNVRQTISFEDAKRYTEEIENHLQAIPQWTRAPSEAPQALLSIILRQYLLVLHDRQIRQSSSKAERSFSRVIIVDTAKKIIDTHTALMDRGCHMLQFLFHDQMRPALSVFHILSRPDPQTDGILGEVMSRTAALVVDDAIELITDKIHRLGCEQRQLWMVLAVNAFMKTNKDPDRKAEFMQEAVDKIMRPYYKIMACQTGDAAGSVNSSGPPMGRMEMPNGIVEYLPTEGQTKPEFGTDPTLLDFDAIAAWTFDDFNFNATDFTAFGDGYQALNP